VRGSSKLFFSLRPFSRLSLVSNIKLEQTQASTWLGKKSKSKKLMPFIRKESLMEKKHDTRKKINIKRDKNIL
jgi:hypothetical protein